MSVWWGGRWSMGWEEEKVGGGKEEEGEWELWCKVIEEGEYEWDDEV